MFVSSLLLIFSSEQPETASISDVAHFLFVRKRCQLQCGRYFRGVAHKNPTETNCDDHQQGETHSTPSSKKRRIIYACIIEAHESVRKRNEETQHRDHEDQIAERTFQFVESSQSCAETFSHTPCNEDSGRKRRSRERMRKIEGPASKARDDSQKQKRGHRAGAKRRQNSSLCDAHGLMPLQELGVRTEVPKIQ